MKRGIQIDTTIVPCIHCKTDYDLAKQSRISKRLKRREIKCPYCHRKVGTLN